MSPLQTLAAEVIAAFLRTPRRRRSDRDALADALAEIAKRDPGAVGRALYAAGFRREDFDLT